MNFGPINMSGGEKRLNVAFSRAKHHMALVTTCMAWLPVGTTPVATVRPQGYCPQCLESGYGRVSRQPLEFPQGGRELLPPHAIGPGDGLLGMVRLDYTVQDRAAALYTKKCHEDRFKSVPS